MITVLLVDDHATVRSGLRLLLSAHPDLEVVGEAGDGAVGVRQARALRPDVTLMDVRMPGLDGIAATREIVEGGWSRVLVLTSFEVDEYVAGALRAGADGYLLKTIDAGPLADAIRRVAGGEAVLAPEVTRQVIAGYASATPATPETSPAAGRVAAIGALTARERDVLVTLGRGLSNADIAASLGISELTAKTHVSRVLGKLGCTSRVQAALIAHEAGLS
ncbi:response regulator [Arsenicicoccus sp. oral taxon 190]|uniref:response regulator n=1 Tax=Arsenicicoccus sp. oral taxon 190 TaxID=1658671 RepID=UPI000679FFE4|nr:response regulator transcription factor [Arsenicicoccus sp. oral taxon 190]AKT50654.1 LuxR family transcriptional regulator [Arsenicicoccus sp. oral taxon 190]